MVGGRQDIQVAKGSSLAEETFFDRKSSRGDWRLQRRDSNRTCTSQVCNVRPWDGTPGRSVAPSPARAKQPIDGHSWIGQQAATRIYTPARTVLWVPAFLRYYILNLPLPVSGRHRAARWRTAALVAPSAAHPEATSRPAPHSASFTPLLPSSPSSSSSSPGDMMRARGEVALAALLAAAALLLSSLDSRSDVRLLDIGDADAELLPLDGAAGPESLVFFRDGDGDGDGGLFTGVSDGRVLRWVPAQRRWAEHSSSAPDLLDRCRGSQDPGREQECGRPLGLKFNHDTGELYVADAYHGLRVVAPDDKVSRPVAPQWWQGTRPFSFANGVELDPDTGAVYFTETSTRFQRREFLSIVISGDTTGRLLRYDPKSASGEVEVLVDGLAFPNGLAMSRDGTHLLLAETTTGRILRYWLRTAALEEVARLPWFPDNIRMSPRGGFWVGLHAKRGKLAEWCISYPWLRRLLLSLPPRHVQRASWLLNRLGRQVIALRLSEEDGKVMEMVSVHGDLQKVFRSVSEVQERNSSLWIGSVMSPFLGVYKL